MKIALSELKPNKFKKHINKGKLNPEQVAKIKANIKELGLMGSLPIYKEDGNYHLIAGHHRLKALKEVYGKDFKIEVTLHPYKEDQILRGMVVENLTHRQGEALEELENLKLIRKYLTENPVFCALSAQNTKGRWGEGRPEESGSCRHISEWLNQQGEVMSYKKISTLLRMSDTLAPELLKKLAKATTTSIDNQEDLLPVKTAEALMQVTDQEEQKALARVVMDTESFPSNIDRAKAITTYQELAEDDKQKVLKGELQLGDVLNKEDAMGSGRYALKFNRKVAGLIVEMRTLRKTLVQFRKEKLFSQFTKNQRTGLRERLEKIRVEYSTLMKELDESIGVMDNE